MLRHLKWLIQRRAVLHLRHATSAVRIRYLSSLRCAALSSLRLPNSHITQSAHNYNDDDDDDDDDDIVVLLSDGQRCLF